MMRQLGVNVQIAVPTKHLKKYLTQYDALYDRGDVFVPFEPDTASPGAPDSAAPDVPDVLVEPDGSIYGLLATSDVDAAFEAGARR